MTRRASAPALATPTGDRGPKQEGPSPSILTGAGTGRGGHEEGATAGADNGLYSPRARVGARAGFDSLTFRIFPLTVKTAPDARS